MLSAEILDCGSSTKWNEDSEPDFIWWADFCSEMLADEFISN